MSLAYPSREEWVFYLFLCRLPAFPAPRGGEGERHPVRFLRAKVAMHCIKTKAYIAQKSVNIHSGPDSKVMHRFTTRMPFSQSSVMMMDTSPVHCIWHAKARYARFLTVPTARVIHIPPAQHTGLSLAGWTRPPFAIARSLQRSHWDVKFFKIKQYTNTFPNT